MEELHFSNIVQYEANLLKNHQKDKNSSASASFADLVIKAPHARESSVPNRRMAKTIDHDEDTRHKS